MKTYSNRMWRRKIAAQLNKKNFCKKESSYTKTLFSCQRDNLTTRMFAKFDPHNLPELIRCGPMKLGRCYPADVLDMDPYEEIKSYIGPVLLVHGTKDKL